MADISPFRGLRYNHSLVNDLSQVICPPYDVISSELQEALYQRSPYNIIRLEYGKAKPESDHYAAISHIFNDWRRQGILIADPQPAFYLQRESYIDDQGTTRTRYAILGRIRLQADGAILPHEETRAAAKQDRLDLVSACRANFSPIMGLYRDTSGEILQVIERTTTKAPVLQISDAQKETLALWRIPESLDIDILQDTLRPLPFYIADGHHRYETSVTYQNLRHSQRRLEDGSNYAMMALTDLADPGLHILGYHRLLGGLGTTFNQFLDNQLESIVEQILSVELPPDDQEATQQLKQLLREYGERGRILGLLDRRGTRFRILAFREEAVSQLAHETSTISDMQKCDVWALQAGILDPLMGQEPSQNSSVVLEYTANETEALQLVRQGSFQLAFLVLPMPLEVFEGVVRQGVRLPPKSTYFTPKLPTGLVIYAFDVG